jgi:hypothetical protein
MIPVVCCASFIFASCATIAHEPSRIPETSRYAFSANDESLIRSVFGEGLLEELRPCVYTVDLGNPVYKAAYIPSRNEIWLNKNIQIEPLTLLHEATHYYQRNRLGRKMTSEREYDLPADLSLPMNLEQEAMLVMGYASIIEASSCGPTKGILPPLAPTIRYLRTYMSLDPSAPALDGG